MVSYCMGDIDSVLAAIKRNSKNIRFSDLGKLCDFYFGEPRQIGTSHRVYKMPWAGDPRVNIQIKGGKAKIYQVRQVLRAIERLEVERGNTE